MAIIIVIMGKYVMSLLISVTTIANEAFCASLVTPMICSPAVARDGVSSTIRYHPPLVITIHDVRNMVPTPNVRPRRVPLIRIVPLARLVRSIGIPLLLSAQVEVLAAVIFVDHRVATMRPIHVQEVMHVVSSVL